MNDTARQKLCDIIARYGRDITTDARRCEGLMRDNFPNSRREIAVLTAALEQRIPPDLINTQATPLSVTLARLAARLHDDVAMEQTAANWAVNTWALALGVITTQQLAAIEAANQTSNTQLNQSSSTRSSTIESPTVIVNNSANADASNANVKARVSSSPTIKVSPIVKASSAVTAKVSPPPPLPSSLPPPPNASSNAAPTSLTVAADGSGDYLSITEALNNAAANSRITVRSGVYVESLVLDKETEIIGDGAREEIIIQATDASCLTMRANIATVRNLTLQGLGATAGNGNFFAVDIPRGRLILEDCDVTSDSLSCVAIHNREAEPVLRRCRIHGGADSGVYCFNDAGGVLEDCEIFDNANINIAVNNARTNIKNCTVHHGADAGIVVWNQSSNVIEDCDIYAHAASCVGVSDDATTTIRRTRIHEGANTGIYVHRNAQASVEDCDIYAHDEGEIAVTTGGDVRARKCQIFNSRISGVVVKDAGRATLETCRVYDNGDSGVHVDAGGLLVARSSRICRNNHVGISVESGGAVDVENCDLTRNRVAAWQSDYGSHVESRNNEM